SVLMIKNDLSASDRHFAFSLIASHYYCYFHLKNCLDKVTIYSFAEIVFVFGTLNNTNTPTIKKIAKKTIEFRILPVIWSMKPYKAIPITIPIFSDTS